MIRQLRSNDAMELQRMLQQGSPIVDGQLVSILPAATTSVQSARHGLGRAYKGAWLVSFDSALSVLRVMPPESQLEPETYVYFALSTANSAAGKLWVF